MSISNAIKGRIAKRQGAAAEMHAVEYLRYLGLLKIDEIETGWTIIRHPVIRNKILKAFPNGKVAGDIRAVLPGGRSVLAEVKSMKERLCWSNLESHQPTNLDDHAAAGGLSLLIWRHERGICVLPWKPIGFTGPRCSLSIDAAEVQAIRRPHFWLPTLPPFNS